MQATLSAKMTLRIYPSYAEPEWQLDGAVRMRLIWLPSFVPEPV
jgi:hypothetical protein